MNHRLFVDVFTSSYNGVNFFVYFYQPSTLFQVRTEYLSLFHGILTSSTYTDLKRRASEFKRHFDAILNDATNESDVDVYIVREVMHRFPDMFC